MANTRLPGGAERFTGDRDRAAEARRKGIEPAQRTPYSHAERQPQPPRGGGGSGKPGAAAGGTAHDRSR